MNQCPIDGREFDPAGKGKRVFCSVGCRRSAEFKVRRLQRSLERLERLRDDLEVKVAGRGAPPHAGTLRELETREEQIERAEQRMLEVLGWGDDGE